MYGLWYVADGSWGGHGPQCDVAIVVVGSARLWVIADRVIFLGGPHTSSPVPRRNRLRRKRLAEELRKARLAAELTQDAVAQETGIRQTTLSKFERGAHFPDPMDFALIAKVVGLDWDVVLSIALDPALADAPRPRPSHLRGPRKGAPRDRD